MLVLLLGGLFLKSDARDLLLGVTHKFFTVRAQTFFIALDSFIKLLCQLSDALILELELLSLQGTIAFEFNAFLCELVQGLRVLRTKGFDFIIHFILFGGNVVASLLKRTLLLSHLLKHGLFLVFKSGDLSFLLRYFKRYFLNLGHHLLTLLVELISLLL